MKTRFQTRAFVLCFLPFAILLTGSFWLVQRFVESMVRQGLQASLHDRQLAIANIHASAELQNSRFLKIAGENSALKAGIQLLLTYPHNPAAQRTVEDQLRELGGRMGFDLMRVEGPDGRVLAAVARTSPSSGQLVPLDPSQVERSRAGILVIGNRRLQVASVPIDADEENLAVLSVGEFFNFSAAGMPAVLVRNGRVLGSNLPGISPAEFEGALAGCSAHSECELRLAGSRWIALPVQFYGDGYSLISVENLDAATAPIQIRLRKLFLTLTSLFIVIALLCSYAASKSIVNPIAAMVAHLRSAVRTGKLTELASKPYAIFEIDELAAIYNRAAQSVQQAGDRLESAYLEFVSSLAQALDARDPYTAGHSWRVSQLSCAVASALQLPPDVIERIRIGALLHDIGKMGISDQVLQKPGRLTQEEFDLVKQHPVIGRRILEAVQGFAPYLDAVELHHENWNGTGYPHRQTGEETPIDARIIHVSDAYDAMTTDRSYRRGMTHDGAIDELRKFAGIQFDPRIVNAFVNLQNEAFSPSPAPADIANLHLQAQVLAI